MRPLRALALSVLLATAATAGVETNAAAGGSVEELRAVLGLDPQQADRLRQLFSDAEMDLERRRDQARSRGTVVPIDDLVAWQSALRERVRSSLGAAQQPVFDGWMARKASLAREYDRALFGIPMPTELKLRLSLSPETTAKMMTAADESLAKIREAISQLRAQGRPLGEIGEAVNEHRKDAIRKMLEAATSTEQRRIRDWLKTWFKPAADKLPGTERDRLDRVMKSLDIADGATGGRTQELVAGILWHMTEADSLKRSLGKDLLMAILRSKAEVDVWISLHEHRAVIAVHQARLRELRGDLQDQMPTRQVAKLVAEGVLE